MRALWRWVRNRWRRCLVVLILAVCGCIAWRDTMADPVVKRTTLAMPGLAAGSPPLRLVLLSDLHVAGPDMPPARLARIVAQVNALEPDLVLFAGDFISDRVLATHRYPFREALAPLAGIEAPLGAVAVLGNHDHWRDARAARAELSRIGIPVLKNGAITRGPLRIGGLDDEFTRHDDMKAMLAALGPRRGREVVIGHSPDSFPDLPEDVPLMLAGHTHCGQGRLPLIGAPFSNSRYGERYLCGRIDEDGRTLIVTAGLGVSVLPFRFGVEPDLWVVTLYPPPKGEDFR